ncbi:calcium-activated chloride channel regulator 1-like isoform X2 [Ostrea edulis]|nr:calcium-activated chloride channel regulator 1-like isoform X2 [Ostrea edulis]
MTGCGQPGKQIHLEPFMVQILPAVGYADKLLVHHWGHFRWGLFDEHGDKESPVQTSNTNTWFYSSEGTFKPNICAKGIKGKSRLKYCGNNAPCALDNKGLPTKDCKFCVDETGNTERASIMGKPEISSVTEFCDDDTSDVPHNKEADTPHNRICKGKSAWEIMRLHSDFKGTTPGSTSLSTVPTFRVVQQRAGQTVVMVLDRSGSMNSNQRITKLKEISSIFIMNWLSNGSSIGVVTFDDDAKIVAPITSVVSESVRRELTTLIDKIEANGRTSIGLGLRKGLELLKANGESINGSEIILVSDGKNNVSPAIDDVRDEILAANVIVTTVAIGNLADKDMEKLAKDTGGSSHFYSGEMQSTALSDSFVKFAECTSDEESKMHQIESESLRVMKYQNYSTVISIDDTIGRDTVVLLQGPRVQFSSVSLSGPTGRVQTSDNCTGSCRIMIDGVAEVGEYVIDISSSVDTETILTLTVQSYSRDPSVDVFTATSWILTDSLDFSPSTTLVMYALIRKGASPVLDADVAMTVENLEGHVMTIDLFDNGVGEDMLEGDGLYTGVILPSQIQSNGRHSLKLIVTGKSGETKILIPKAKRKKRAAQDEVPPTDLETKAVNAFKRVESSGTFTVLNYSPEATANDSIPPARITTLQVVYSEGNHFNISWDAVGDDIAYGNATSYKILLSKNYSTLLNSPENVSPLNGNIPTPKLPGNTEVFSLTLPEASATYYLAVRAVDEFGNEGDISNIISLSVVTDNTWRPVEVNPSSMSYEHLLVSSCAAAFVVLIVILCGCCIYKRRNRPKRKAKSKKGELRNDFSNSREFGRDPRHSMYMYQSQIHNEYNTRPPRHHVSAYGSHLYHIS